MPQVFRAPPLIKCWPHHLIGSIAGTWIQAQARWYTEHNAKIRFTVLTVDERAVFPYVVEWIEEERGRTHPAAKAETMTSVSMDP